MSAEVQIQGQMVNGDYRLILSMDRDETGGDVLNCFVFLYTDRTRSQMLNTLTRCALDPDCSLTCNHAALLREKDRLLARGISDDCTELSKSVGWGKAVPAPLKTPMTRHSR